MLSPRQIAALGLACATLSFAVPSAVAQAPSVELDERTDAKIAKLLGQLGNDNFPVREKAQESLQQLALQFSEQILDRALENYLVTADPEVRYRLRSTMFNSVAANVPRNGFIGIRMETPVVLNRAGQREMPSTVGIRDVIANSAAEKFGLQPGDKITELDGKPFSMDQRALPPSYQLQQYVSSRTEGTPLKLTIQRGGRTLDVALELGGMPEEFTPDRQERLFADWMHEEMVERGLEEPKPQPTTPSYNRLPGLPRTIPPIVPPGNPVPVPPENLFPKD